MKRRYIGGAIAIVAVSCGLAVFVFKTAPTTRMTDGTVLVLERVALGGQVSGRRMPWLGPVRALASRLLGIPTFQRFANPDALVVWISRRDPGSDRFLNFDNWSRSTLVDEHGCEFGSRNYGVEANEWSATGLPLPKAPPNSKYVLGSVINESFPRRSSELRLRFYDHSGERLGELPFENPFVEEGPSWSPGPLPGTHVVGDTAFTLLSLTNRLIVRTEEGRQFERISLVPRWEVKRNASRIVGEWIIGESRIGDPGGNTGGLDGFSLCTNEPAWKLDTWFYRAPKALGTVDVWTVPGVAVPDSVLNQPVLGTNLLHGVSIRIIALSGPANVTYSNGIPVSVQGRLQGGGGEFVKTSNTGRVGAELSSISIESDKAHALLSIEGLTPDQRFDFWATDSTGHRTFFQRSQSGPYYLFTLASGSLSGEIDLHCGVQEKRKVSFLVAPPDNPVSDDLFGEAERNRILALTPPRAAETDPGCIDLAPSFTRALGDPEFLLATGPISGGGASRSYRSVPVPVGVQPLAGVVFDVRGVIQVAGLALSQEGHWFPTEVRDIQVGKLCREMHFLHGAVWVALDGTPIGEYLVEYSDGEVVTIPIVYGRDVRDGGAFPFDPLDVSDAEVAWPAEGLDKPESRIRGVLYRKQWKNPHPEKMVKTIALRSLKTSVGPFLVALTVEP